MGRTHRLEEELPARALANLAHARSKVARDGVDEAGVARLRQDREGRFEVLAWVVHDVEEAARLGSSSRQP